jgi:hypothetical protein
MKRLFPKKFAYASYPATPLDPDKKSIRLFSFNRDDDSNIRGTLKAFDVDSRDCPRWIPCPIPGIDMS